MKNIKIVRIFFLVAFLMLQNAHSQDNQKFVVILDAGHGGKDTGAKYHGYNEKDITLPIILKVGEMLEKNSSFKVIYTRKTDEFIELKERANIANRNKANLFVSVHCNANKNTAASGSETYVMGMSRSNMNLEVSKAENSVIFLEDNYKKTYKGFDPNKPETLIGLKMIQEDNLISSIDLATKVQDNFKANGIVSRGVKQEPIWVLDASVMPGVLIETGFVSNLEEGTRLSSEQGQTETAKAIVDAITSYKKEFMGENDNQKKNTPNDNPIKVQEDEKKK